MRFHPRVTFCHRGGAYPCSLRLRSAQLNRGDGTGRGAPLASGVMRGSVVALLLSASACSACGADERKEPVRGHSEQEVVRYFEERTGKRLVAVEDSPGAAADYAPDYLALPGSLNDSVEALRAEPYGLFGLAVVDDRRGFAYELNPGGARSRRDPDGTYWYRAPEGHPRGGPAWFASRVYDNVVLTWEAGRHRRLDRRFRRLDRIMRSLP